MPQPNAVKCLVVDDEPRLRRVLVRLLEGEGFTCAEAGSGVEALEMLHHEQVPLVISDLRMPDGRGGAVARDHRQEAGHRRHRSEEHTSELQSQSNLVCRLLLEKKNTHS